MRVVPDTVIIVDVKRFTDTGDADLIPPLKPKDTVLVPGGALHAFGKVVGFISQIAAIATAYMVISQATK